ncbi:protein bicaudal C homolog 1-A [Aplysia californica]|uniref:Protein bicaudal C homolog 1-A n=1 Tax=Aplysia californica TaxID=6500 RepID=A0ABM0ZXH1_APLCA|nr:protein bicaudal C homolog 1-A [Aplysia californica]
MAEGAPVLSARMRENLFIGDNGVDSIDTASQGSRDEIIDRDPGFVEDRFRVDRKKLEQMLQLVPPSDDTDEGAEEFFQRVMEETNTQITWPSKLKIGAKSKKDPHIKVIGYPENVSAAKSKIMNVLDTKSNRVTLKMDVSHTEHSHVIGKGGNNIKRVMMETGCHIHFPDSNRGNSIQEKSNQVSIAGQPDGVETARAQIRELLPLVFMLELPVSSPSLSPEANSPLIQQLQQAHGVTITVKQRARTTYASSTLVVRGSVHSAKGVKQATARLMETLAGNMSLPVSMQLEIAPQHHLFIIGRGGVNIKHIMQRTGANILFPDPNTASPQRKGTVYISGTVDSVFMARQHLIGCLPLVLMFDVKETIELDQVRISQLMEQLDVYISVKPKPKQPSKSVIVKSIERNAANMYLTREILLGLKTDAKISALHSNILKGDTPHFGLSLAGLGFLSPNMLNMNAANFVVNGQPSGGSAGISGSPCPASPVSPSHWLAQNPSTAVYSPLMVVTPASSVPSLDVLSPSSNGFHHDFSSSAFIRVPTPHEPGHSSNNSDSTSPPHSPSNSPTPVGLCNTAADLANLQKTGTLGEALSQSTTSTLLAGVIQHQHALQQQQQQQQQQQLHKSAQQQPLPPHLQQHHHHCHPQHVHHHHHHQHPLDLLGLSKTASLTQLSSMTQCPPSPAPLFNGLAHHPRHMMNGDEQVDPSGPVETEPSDKLAPGIERKNSATSLFNSPLQFTFDYEQKKLLAMKAMQKKPEGESRIPTDIWAGMGFSKSMPESAIRDKLGQMGISARCTDAAFNSGYEANRPEIDLSIDKDLWNNDESPERGSALVGRPLNKAPGEYPSPRKKFQYGLSHSNHVDSASLPSSKGLWSTKTDLAELFSALGLGKYTDLFQQQEIDLSTFLTLSDHDLKELGISTFGARRKMLLAIADLNKRRNLMPHNTNSRPHLRAVTGASRLGSGLSSPDSDRGDAGGSSGGGSGLARGGCVSELFPSPNPPSALMNARGGPDLGSLSGHW